MANMQYAPPHPPGSQSAFAFARARERTTRTCPRYSLHTRRAYPITDKVDTPINTQPASPTATINSDHEDKAQRATRRRFYSGDPKVKDAWDAPAKGLHPLRSQPEPPPEPPPGNKTRKRKKEKKIISALAEPASRRVPYGLPVPGFGFGFGFREAHPSSEVRLMRLAERKADDAAHSGPGHLTLARSPNGLPTCVSTPTPNRNTEQIKRVRANKKRARDKGESRREWRWVMSSARDTEDDITKKRIRVSRISQKVFASDGPAGCSCWGAYPIQYGAAETSHVFLEFRNVESEQSLKACRMRDGGRGRGQRPRRGDDAKSLDGRGSLACERSLTFADMPGPLEQPGQALREVALTGPRVLNSFSSDQHFQAKGTPFYAASRKFVHLQSAPSIAEASSRLQLSGVATYQCRLFNHERHEKMY
ncbi:hypothetical protein DFH11DRAFT_1762065 [Phellopilus nigrolimitatus]|nr:hypothetical protein DFH11DRAFT_1762065 [Phellopilus nigrolimitatus]